MNHAESELVVAFELHSVEQIRAALDKGIDPRAPIDGKPPIVWLTEMYTRSKQFGPCLKLLLDRGAELEDARLVHVLLDDGPALAAAIRADRSLLSHRTSMRSAFTPLDGATLLHVAAEFGRAEAARVLLELGAEVDARAGLDEHGLGGHTPLFHTVNSILDHAAPVLRLLLKAGARTDVQVSGLTWGKGFEWETTVFDVTPISYAQLGLLPQMHRKEQEIYANVRLLLQSAQRPVPPLANVPNRYLLPKRKVP